MSTGWIRGRFVGTYAGELTAVHGDGARRFAIELQSGSVHDAQWVEPPADASDGDDGDGSDDEGQADHDGAPDGLHRKPRLSHVRFAPPGEGERVGTLYDLRVEVTRLRRAHETGNRSFGRLEGTIVARTSPPRPAIDLTAPTEPLAAPTTTPAAGNGTTDAAQPDAAGAAVQPEATGPVLAVAPRVEPLRPFVEPIRRASAVPLDPVPRGFHPAWLLVALVMGWAGVSTWLMCGPAASATWAAPLLVGSLLRRSTLRLRLRGGEALGWANVALVFAQLLLLVGPAESAWRADCLPPLGLRLPLQAGLVVLTVLLARLGPIAVAALCWTFLTFGWCDHVDGTCGERAARARAEQRWPKDPERVADAIDAKPLDARDEPAPRATPSTPPPARTVAPGVTSSTPPTTSAPAPAEPAPAPALAPTPAPAPAAEPPPPREPPHPAAPISMEQANRKPASFFASKGKRSVVLPTQPIFGQHGALPGAEISAEGTIELSRLAALLKLQGKRRVLLEVHTESRGDAAREQALTNQQAHAVRMWLERTGGVDTARLEVVGLGSRRPLATLPATSDLPDTDSRLELHVLDAPVR